MAKPFKCVRCGYCCHTLHVAIVVEPARGIVEGNLSIHSGEGPCRHLLEDAPGKYKCSIHNESWYQDTPCAAYTQVGGGVCRTGQAILSGQLKAPFLKEVTK